MTCVVIAIRGGKVAIEITDDEPVPPSYDLEADGEELSGIKPGLAKVQPAQPARKVASKR